MQQLSLKRHPCCQKSTNPPPPNIFHQPVVASSCLPPLYKLVCGEGGRLVGWVGASTLTLPTQRPTVPSSTTLHHHHLKYTFTFHSPFLHPLTLTTRGKYAEAEYATIAMAMVANCKWTISKFILYRTFYVHFN